MLINYHGHNEIEADLGDYLCYMKVDGSLHEGILLKVEQPVWPHNISYVSVLNEGTVSRVNTNLIFRFKNMIRKSSS